MLNGRRRQRVSMKRENEQKLLQSCIEGSETAWRKFYQTYVGLVRSVVKKKIGPAYQESDDMVQEVFVMIVSSLRSYDPKYTVAKFVCMIAERACIDMYRRKKAQKRSAYTEPLDHHDGEYDGAVTLTSDGRSPEEEVANYEDMNLLRTAINSIGARCRELLRLRYYDETPYKEICTMQGGKENTLAVRLRSCLDQLSRKYHELMDGDS